MTETNLDEVILSKGKIERLMDGIRIEIHIEDIQLKTYNNLIAMRQPEEAGKFIEGIKYSQEKNRFLKQEYIKLHDELMRYMG